MDRRTRDTVCLDQDNAREPIDLARRGCAPNNSLLMRSAVGATVSPLWSCRCSAAIRARHAWISSCFSSRCSSSSIDATSASKLRSVIISLGFSCSATPSTGWPIVTARAMGEDCTFVSGERLLSFGHSGCAIAMPRRRFSAISLPVALSSVME